LPWYTQTLAFIELPVDNVYSQASMFHLQCVILSETCWGKNAEAAGKVLFFNLKAIFTALSQTLELHIQHIKPLQ
jgi:hypothetical protein